VNRERNEHDARIFLAALLSDAIADLFHYGLSFGVAVLTALAAAALLEANRRSAARQQGSAQSRAKQFNDREARV
jgi:hypothetical protein